ncbi:MAG: tetratricopeptide repeat protein [bacterium]
MKFQSKFFIYFILFLICLNIFCAYYNTFYNAKKYYNSAYTEIKKLNSTKLNNKARKNLEMSIEKSLKLLELYPKSKYVDDALLILGKSYFYQKQYFSSRIYLEQLIQEKPNSGLIPQAKLWLIKTEVADEKYHNAELKIKDLLEEKLPEKIKAEVYFIQAKLYRNKNNYQKAVDYYNTCINISNILRPEALFEVGLIYDSLNNYQQSAAYFKKVFTLNPDEPYNFQSRLRYGIALKKQNKIDLALKNFDKLLINELNEKQTAKVHLHIADCLMKQGDFKTSLLEYGDIVKNFPQTEESAAAYYQLGKFFENNMKYKKALQNYLQVKNEYAASVYVDSSKTRQEALFKLLALQKMISVSNQDSSKAKEISNKIIFSDLEDSYFFEDTSTVSLIQHEKKDTINTEDEKGQHEDSEDTDTNQHTQISGNFQEKKEKSSKKLQEVINPEINKLNVNKLDKNLFLLSEIFMLYFNKPDSALTRYKFLIDSLPESKYTPKAYFNTAYIYDTIKNDSLKADSIYKLIINKFPNSETAERVRIKLGEDIKESDEHKILQLHRQAEKYMLDEKNPSKTCEIYTDIINTYPDSELLPKIYYSLGWCYEYELDSLNTAYMIYDSLLSKYPDSKYSKRIKEKVQHVKNFEEKEAEKEKGKEENKVTVDSTLQEFGQKLNVPSADTTAQDTLNPDLKDKKSSQDEKNIINT